ncbi:hypothetical protein FKM82_030682 [Ascaphus truei]
MEISQIWARYPRRPAGGARDEERSFPIESEWSNSRYRGLGSLDCCYSISDVSYFFLISGTIHWAEKMGPTIGIFSRAGEEEYKWLISWLRSVSSGIVVRPFYISNNNGQRFREEVSKCTVAILYHSKKRGRVNLTDVTDSLYDEELEYLSAVRGNANVFVVIDDLDDSGSESKNRILTQQPKIRNLASDVFLFTREEKESSDLHNSPKLNAMRELVNKGAKGRSDYFPGPYVSIWQC